MEQHPDNAMSVQRFRSACQEVKNVLDRITPVEPEVDRPVGEIFEKRAAQLPYLREAEELLTRALVEFPLHPYLLDWRAEVRMAMVDRDTTQLATDGAKADLAQALQVAPDYLLLRVRLAELAAANADEQEAATLFADATGRLEVLACRCVAGYASALAGSRNEAQARTLLARWQLAFPDNDALRDVSSELGSGAKPS